jgi:hypothetical protein
MQRTAHVVGASLLLASCAVPSFGQTGLFGIGDFGTGNSQRLFSIHESTGLATAIGDTGLVDAIDLAFDPTSNQLIALTQGGDRYSINPLTAQATLVSDVSDFIPEGGLAISATGAMYTTNFDDLYFASGTGSFAFTGPSGLLTAFDVSGLAFVNNQLFGFAANGTDADSLVRYDNITGAGTVIGTNVLTASDALGGLAWNFAGTDLFATNGSSLFRMNTTDGSATLIGALGAQGVSGIAYIPSPASSIAFIGPLFVLTPRRRRRTL